MNKPSIVYSVLGMISGVWLYSFIPFFIGDSLYWSLFCLSGIGYLIGSVPTGLLLSYYLQLGDLSLIGSGNIGATNVLRTGDKKAAFLTLLGDILKGTCATFLILLLPETIPHRGFSIALLGFSAFIGHIFPLWLSFKGGKGVATYLGVLLGLHPVWFVIAATIWSASTAFKKISSLSALAMVLLLPFIILCLQYEGEEVGVIIAMSIIVIIKHIPNIKRIFYNKESTISWE